MKILKILSNKTWYAIQTEMIELKMHNNNLKKENTTLKEDKIRLERENDTLKQGNNKLHDLYEKMRVAMQYTGVVRDKNGRYVSTKKK